MGELKPKTYVLRIGHRPERDKRITTHVALAARALGASGFFLADECDFSVIRSILRVEETWGQGLDLISCGLPWRFYVELWRKRNWPVVHLTMYGVPVDDVVGGLRETGKPVLVAVGAEKVPTELYELANYNVSVTNQPHSEVSALAIFLDRLYSGQELYYSLYENPRLKVEPSSREKRVIRLGSGK